MLLIFRFASLVRLQSSLKVLIGLLLLRIHYSHNRLVCSFFGILIFPCTLRCLKKIFFGLQNCFGNIDGSFAIIIFYAWICTMFNKKLDKIQIHRVHRYNVDRFGLLNFLIQISSTLLSSELILASSFLLLYLESINFLFQELLSHRYACSFQIAHGRVWVPIFTCIMDNLE